MEAVYWSCEYLSQCFPPIVLICLVDLLVQLIASVSWVSFINHMLLNFLNEWWRKAERDENHFIIEVFTRFWGFTKVNCMVPPPAKYSNGSPPPNQPYPSRTPDFWWYFLCLIEATSSRLTYWPFPISSLLWFSSFLCIFLLITQIWPIWILQCSQFYLNWHSIGAYLCLIPATLSHRQWVECFNPGWFLSRLGWAGEKIDPVVPNFYPILEGAVPLPSGKHTKSYWKWPFIVSFPIKNGDFP
jgi:hypothetical protein